MNTDTKDDAVTQITAEAAAEAMPWKCLKCTKRFMSKAGLLMHDMRVHTKIIKAQGQKGFKPNPDNAKRKKSYPSDDAAVKRKKYRIMRDRFHAMGLDAKGRPFKSEFGRRTSLAMRQHPVRWTPERTAKFRATMKQKAQEKAMAREHPNSLKAKKRIQFVYPVPTPKPTPTIEEAIANTWPEDQPTTAIRFCPHCGNNIEKHL